MKNIFLFLCLILSLSLGAKQDNSTISVDSIPKKQFTAFQYLQQDSILNMHFVTDVKKLKKWEEESENHKAKLTLSNTSVKKKKWKVKLEQRGNLRRQVCSIKPQKLKFSKKQLTKRGLIARKNIKMVLRCGNEKSGNRQVLNEYLTYRLYNILTDKSYRVQLIQATFEDTVKTKNGFKTYGFLIEPTKELGVRNWATMSEAQGIKSSSLIEKDYLVMAIFQYMVGNTDWNIVKAHNIKFLKAPAENLYTPIPYDFDFTGLVNAHYAAPNDALPTSKVTERLFIGGYKDEKLLKETLQLFQSKKAEMKEMVLNFQYLNEKERKLSWHYLEDFFKAIYQLENPSKLFPQETIFQDIMKLEKRKVN